MDATMMDYPLTITQIYEHGRRVHSDREILTFQGDSVRRATFGEVGERAERLASGLAALGVEQGDVVATFGWNHQEHLEAYLAVPCMGAVLHTLNIRLFADQLRYVIDHAGDKVVIVDDSLIPLLAAVVDDVTSPRTYVVVGDGDASALGDRHVVRYDDLLAGAGSFEFPVLDEQTAAAACYTSGTTGDPKGVVYSHRSQWCHTMGSCAGGFRLTDQDRILMIVPMFHANAWGLPYVAWMNGTEILQPERYLQPEPLVAMIEQLRPTFAAAVPTVWTGVLQACRQRASDLSSLKEVMVGGAAVPRQMIEEFRESHGVTITQGWGMTETSPLAAVSSPPPGVPAGGDEELDWRARTGRVIGGVDLRITEEDGTELPWDGKTIGEIEVRGPWIAGSYAGGVEAVDKFRADGWLRTGDMATVEPNGFVQIVDRTKDVIKSGGEWVSSVELENAIMGHPAVIEAAVIGVPDDKWNERPCACVVVDPSQAVTPSAIAGHLDDKVASWWIPERWAFVEEIPKTSVGKFDKKVLRSRYSVGDLDIELLET